MKNDFSLVLDILRIKQEGNSVQLFVQNISASPLSLEYIKCKEHYKDRSSGHGRVVFGAFLKKGEEAKSIPYSVAGLERVDFNTLVSFDSTPDIPLRGKGIHKAFSGWKLDRN